MPTVPAATPAVTTAATVTPGLDPCYLFFLAFVISALAGLGNLLRSDKRLTTRLMISAVLNSGALGLVVSMLLYSWFKDNTWFLLGLCLLAGLSGASILNFIVMIIRRGGADIEIIIAPKRGGTDEDASFTGPQPQSDDKDVQRHETSS
jgi:hypothetical protein